jgi:hypothetical protein
MRGGACASHARPPGRSTVFDILYLVIGAAFLAACGLYAAACERL